MDDSTTIDDDASLVLRIRAGEQDAWRTVYERYADRCYGVCFSVLRGPDAADATHEAFVVAMRRIDTLKDPGALRPWLLRIAWTEAMRINRRRARAVATDDRFLSGGSSRDLAPDASAEQSELAELVQQASAGLDSDDRIVLELGVRQGLRADELARVMGVSPGYARKRLERVRARTGRALGALLVASRGARDCAALRDVLAGWDGRYTPLVRKRVACHIDGCGVCEANRATMASPMALLAATAVVAPPALRESLVTALSQPAALQTGGAGTLSAYRFARLRRRGRTRAVALTATAALLGGTLFLVTRPEPTATTSPPVTVAETGRDTTSMVALTGKHRAVVVWTGDHDRVWARAQRAGATWSAEQELTAGFAGPRGLSQLLEMPDGTVCAFWKGFAVDDRDAFTNLDSHGLYRRCFDGDNWTDTARTETRGGGISGITTGWAPTVAPDGTILAPWTESSSLVGYGEKALSDDDTNGFLLAAVDRSDRLHVVWRNGKLGFVHRWSPDHGRTWSDTVPIEGNMNVLRLVADDQGGLYLTSTVNRRVLMSHWTLGGGWSDQVKVTDGRNDLIYTGLASVEGGRAAVLWLSNGALAVTVVHPDGGHDTPQPVPGTQGTKITRADATVDGRVLHAVWTEKSGRVLHAAIRIEP